MAEAERCQNKLDMAQRLVGALSANGVIWEQTVEKTSEELIYIPGDSLVACSFASYLGVFSRDYRETATASFVDFLQARNVPLGPEISPLQVLSTEAEQARWCANGLPSDRVSLENGAIMSCSQRWSLVIDPQLQGIVWIKNKESENKLEITRMGAPRMVQLFEKSIETGKSVLVENMGEHIDAVLQPVIARNTIKRGARKVLKLGDKDPERCQGRHSDAFGNDRQCTMQKEKSLEQAQQSASHKIAALSVAKPSACNAVWRRAARMGSEAVDDFAKLEADVIRWLLAREDVQSSVHLALAGKTDEASDAILTIVKGLIDTAPTPSVPSVPSKQPKAKLAKRAATRPTSHEAPEKRARQEADEYWLDACSRAVEADRLHCEERHRAKRTSEVHVETPRPEPPQPLFWRIDMPDVLKVLSQRGVLPRNFLPVVRPHVTLLYIGGEGSEERAAARAGLSTSEFQVAKHTLEKLRGSTVAIKMTEIIIEENVACAFVDLPKSIPCGSKVPHLTLGTRQGVPARHANDILEEVREGRQEGITRIRLPKPKELRGVLDLETSATYSGKT
ncbi:ODA11 [Symbiodinium necroappetens]|uniref:ODA11 protein n=1 Tax=Symbiodinium necroappetens TaxID=1628268 RepID=A0A812NHS5_9DINO|nr:ODA11 [Symbiodinium necroappetens]